MKIPGLTIFDDGRWLIQLTRHGIRKTQRGKGGDKAARTALAKIEAELEQACKVKEVASSAVETQQARDFAITVDVLCNRTPAALEQWTLDTYTALVNAYAKLWADYQDKLTAQKMKKSSMQPLGNNPAQNRIHQHLRWRGHFMDSTVPLLT